MKGRGVYLAPYKRGQNISRVEKKKKVEETLKMSREENIDIQ